MSVDRHSDNFPKPISCELTASCTPTHKLAVSMHVPNMKVKTMDWTTGLDHWRLVIFGFNYIFLHSLIVRVQGCAVSCCINENVFLRNAYVHHQSAL